MVLLYLKEECINGRESKKKKIKELKLAVYIQRK